MKKTKSQKIEKQLEEIKELLKEISRKLDKIGKTEIHYHFENKRKELTSGTTWFPAISPDSSTASPE
jgi:hypothetical protein